MPNSPSQVALSQQNAAAERAAARAAARLDEDSQRAAIAAARAAQEKKAEGVVVLDLRGVSGYTDFLVIGTGTSDRQLEAIRSRRVADAGRPARRWGCQGSDSIEGRALRRRGPRLSVGAQG